MTEKQIAEAAIESVEKLDQLLFAAGTAIEDEARERHETAWRRLRSLVAEHRKQVAAPAPPASSTSHEPRV